MKDKITVRVTPEIAEAFDAFVRACPEPIRTRQDGLRHILSEWLIENGYLNNGVISGHVGSVRESHARKRGD